MITYIISFSLAFLTLAIWFFRRASGDAVLWRNFLLISLAVYGGSILFAAAPVAYRMEVVFRDMLFISVFGAAFSFLAGKRTWFIAGLTMSALALFLYVKQFQAHTFPYRAPIALDEDAELLMEMREGSGPASLSAFTKRFGLEFARAFAPADTEITKLDEYYTVNVPRRYANRLMHIQRRLLRHPDVVWVEENEVIQVEPILAETQGAFSGPAKYGLNDPGVANLWAFEQMQMERLFTFFQQKEFKPVKKALVAILDTGVDSKHEDIQANYKSLKAAYDNDPQGHGTHCAGIAAAVSNNGKGIASFSRNNDFYQVASVKVLSAGGMGTQKTIIDGILFASDQGADVISLSLGGPSNQSRQQAYEKAVRYANKKGALVVVAAGNSNRNAKDFSPANTPGVICVSAVDGELNRAVFSNYIQDLKMGIAAPGVNIYSTVPGSKYTQYSGTSMATPQVAGLLALMKSLRPGLNTVDAFDILEQSGKETRDTPLTGKFIQPAEAIQALVQK